MKELFGKAMIKALEKQGLTKEQFAYRVLPAYFLDLIEKYLRVTVAGEENLPKEGPAIFIANHSGYMGFDALMLGHEIHRKSGIVPKLIAHKMWFLHPDISVHVEKLGLTPATFENGLKLLENKRSLVLFPEGEEGNFKPTKYRYRLRQFRRGFVRLALRTGAPICPAVVIGAEETSITLTQLRWAKEIFGIIIPVPLNVIPLPAKWHIRFLEPIRLEKDPARARNVKELTRISRQIRKQLQSVIHEELRKREAIFS